MFCDLVKERLFRVLGQSKLFNKVTRKNEKVHHIRSRVFSFIKLIDNLNVFGFKFTI